MRRTRVPSDETLRRRVSSEALEYGWHPRYSQGRFQGELERRDRKLKRCRRLWQRWPEGKKKVQVVLEHIQSQWPNGLTEKQIRQFVWEMNGGKGSAPRYYWMTVLRWPDGNRTRPLLDGWCEKVAEKPNVWRLSPDVRFEGKFLKPSMRGCITAGEFRAILGHDPSVDGITLHPRGWPWTSAPSHTCRCWMPDEHLIYAGQVREQDRSLFDWDRP